MSQARPSTPKSGKMPVQDYKFNEDAGEHTVACSCGRWVATTEVLMARRFAASHAGEHARARIFDPIPEGD